MARQLKKLDARTELILVNSTPDKDLSSSRIPSVEVSYRGLQGESHSGLVRSSCVRVRHQYPQGTEIRNTRQISIVSSEELAIIADGMGIAELKPEWLGANLLVSGIPDFSRIPPSTRMIFAGGASLVVDLENSPCKYPGEVIERHHPGFGNLFVNAAVGRRGVTAWVEREGQINTGDSIQLYIPPQRIYEL
ncbi:MAG: MOSC domain-containing protein [Gammaproteobacteria bacterium]|nr:MOSC domain-containing protein [Gammaproteobacteria bacterium]